MIPGASPSLANRPVAGPSNSYSFAWLHDLIVSGLVSRSGTALSFAANSCDQSALKGILQYSVLKATKTTLGKKSLLRVLLAADYREQRRASKSVDDSRLPRAKA